MPPYAQRIRDSKELQKLPAEHRAILAAFGDTIDGVLEGTVERFDAFDATVADIQAQLDSLERRGALPFVRTPPVDARFQYPGDSDPQRRAALWQYARRGNAAGGDVLNELSVGASPDGGYFVDPDTNGRVARLIYQTSPIRRIANVERTGSVDALEGILDLDEADSGWVGETETRGETDSPGIGRWRIPMHEQYAQPNATQKILDDDGFDVGNWLERKIASKLGRRENTAFVNGDGVGKPRGFLTYAGGTPAATDVNAWKVIERIPTGDASGFQSASSSPMGNPADCFFDALFALKEEYRDGAVWVMARSTMRTVMKLKDAEGRYLMTGNNITDATPTMLLGHPVVLAEDMPTVAAGNLPIAFGNFMEAYTVVDHNGGLRLLRDPYTQKGRVKFYTYRRVGGDVTNFEAIKLIVVSAS